jgi:lipid-binding SYLF domain-containing protein
MNRRIRHSVAWAVIPAALCALPALAGEKLARKVEASTEVYRELLETPDRGVPRRLLRQAKCIAVIPHVVKGAIGFGGRHGKGVISCRNDEDRWSPPAFLEISGGSFGFQIGVEATDLVLFFMNERGVKSLLNSKFTLGAEASVAAGPAGRSAEASTDIRLKAEIYSYAKSKGLFAGISVEGARLAPNDVAIRRYYGKRIRPETVLFEHQVPSVPSEARAFVAALSADEEG